MNAPAPAADLAAGASVAQADTAVAPAGAQVGHPLSPEFVYQVRFEQLRSMTSLAIAAAGGGVVAIQAGLFASPLLPAVSVICFALATGVCMIGQRELLNEIRGRKGVPGSADMAAKLAELLLGGGVGAAVMLLLNL